MSNFITGGDTSEKLTKEFRRPLSTNAKIEEFSQFSIPDISHLQAYLRKYPSFREENMPFFLFQPSNEELEENARIERRKKEEKENNLRRKKSSERNRLIVFQGEPGPSDIPSQNQAGPSRAYDNIEDALDAALAEEPDSESDEENEDPIILEYIDNQIQQNNDGEFAIYDDRPIEFVDEVQEENINNPVFDFEENEDDDSHYINLISNLPQKRSRKKPSRFDDYDLN